MKAKTGRIVDPIRRLLFKPSDALPGYMSTVCSWKVWNPRAQNHGIISNRKQTYLITNLSLYAPIGAWEPPGSRIPKLEGSGFPSIDSLSIQVDSIEKLLSSLNVTKAYSTDPSPLPI